MIPLNLTMSFGYGMVPNYWDERYASEDGKVFDWYCDYTTLKQYLMPYFRRHVVDFEILIPGCGNSRLGADIYADGFVNITNIDISSVVISQMSDRYSAQDEMEFSLMDARHAEGLPDESFDLIIDKGLFDCQLCCSDNLESAQLLIREMHRLLKPGGVYIIISHGPPESRMGYLTRGVRWAVDTVNIPKTPLEGLPEEGVLKYHYMYTCKKIAV